MPCHTSTPKERAVQEERNKFPKTIYPWLMRKIATPPGSFDEFIGKNVEWGIVDELCHQCALLGDAEVLRLMTDNPHDREARMLVGWWEMHKLEDGRVTTTERHQQHLIDFVKYHCRVHRIRGYLSLDPVEHVIAAHPEMHEAIQSTLSESADSFENDDDRLLSIQMTFVKRGWHLNARQQD